MKKKLFTLFLLYFMMTIAVLYSNTVNNTIQLRNNKWLSTETTHFQFIYQAHSKDNIIPILVTYAEDVYTVFTQIFGYKPDKIKFVINSTSDQQNGYFTGLPLRIVLFPALNVSPDSGHSSILRLFIHELTHYFQANYPEGFMYGLSQVFGTSLVASNSLVPSGAITEGTAVYLETALTNGGRGRDPFFEMIYKGSLYTKTFPSFYQTYYTGYTNPEGRIYTFGYVLMRYILQHSHIENLGQFYKKFNNFVLNKEFSALEKLWENTTVNNQFTSFEEVWDAAITDLHNEYADSFTIPDGTPLFSDTNPLAPKQAPYFWMHPLYTQKGILAIRKTGKKAQIGFISADAQNFTKLKNIGIAEVRSQQHTASLDGNHIVYSSVSETNSTTVGFTPVPQIYAQSNLYYINTQTGKHRQITKNHSLFHPALSPDGTILIAVERINDIYSQIVQVDMQTGEITPLFSAEQTSFYYPRFSPNEQYIVLIQSLQGNNDVILLSLNENAQTNTLQASFYKRLTNDPAMQLFPQFIDNETIMYASNHENITALYTQKITEDTMHLVLSDPVSATSATIVADEIWYTSYGAYGYTIKKQKLHNIPEKITQKPLHVVPHNTSFQAFVPRSLQNNITYSSYYDIPTPRLWHPEIYVANTSPYDSIIQNTFGLGISLYGMNYLQTQSWKASIIGIPQSKQFAATIQYDIATGPLQISYSFLQNFSYINQSKLYKQETINSLEFTLQKMYSNGGFGNLYYLINTRLKFIHQYIRYGFTIFPITQKDQLLINNKIYGNINIGFQIGASTTNDPTRLFSDAFLVVQTFHQIFPLLLSQKVWQYNGVYIVKANMPLHKNGIAIQLDTQLSYTTRKLSQYSTYAPINLGFRTQENMRLWSRVDLQIPFGIIDKPIGNIVALRSAGLSVYAATAFGINQNQMIWDKGMWTGLYMRNAVSFRNYVRFSFDVGLNLYFSFNQFPQFIFNPKYQNGWELFIKLNTNL